MGRKKRGKQVIDGDGYVFIMKNPGQIIRVSDYDPPLHTEWYSHHIPPQKVRDRIVKQAIVELHEGRWVTNLAFLQIMKDRKIRASRITMAIIRYMGDLDLKADRVRHKNYRTGKLRRNFNTIFKYIEYVLRDTLAEYIEISKSREL